MNNISYNRIVNNTRVSSYQDILSNNYDDLHTHLFHIANKHAYDCFINDFNEYSKYPSHSKRYDKIKLLINSQLIDTYENFQKYISFIELKNDDYDWPSRVIWRTKTYPFMTLSIKDEYNNNINYWFGDTNYTPIPGAMNLQHWWPASLNSLEYDLNRFNVDRSYPGFEIIYIDYVKDQVTLYNRYKDSYLWVKINELSDNVPLSDDYSLENTFSSLHKL